ILLAQGVLACLGLGVAYVPSVAVVSHYFHRRRSLMMALVQSGTPLGAIVHPILLKNTLHNSQIGFGNAVRISAGINSALLLLACILVRLRLPLLHSTQHQEITQMVSFWATMKRVHRDRAYVLATIGMTAFVIAFWYPIFCLQLDAVTHGVGHTFAFYVLVIMNASGLVGRVVWGFLAEIFGVANVVTAAAGCGTALVLGIILRTIASVVVPAILNGFVAGVYAALLPPLLASLTEYFAEVGWYDTAHGLSFTIEGFGGLIGSPICGALLTAHFIWWRPALYSGVSVPQPFNRSRIVRVHPWITREWDYPGLRYSLQRVSSFGGRNQRGSTGGHPALWVQLRRVRPARPNSLPPLSGV
ncbi:major facilitator superfamily domain-containing protein, partial [Mycena rebaudengoi]